MRYVTLLGALALSSVSGIAVTQAAMAAEAQAAPRYSTAKTTIGVLMADPKAREIVVRIIPEFATGQADAMERASGMTLVELKAAVGAYAPDLLSDARLAQLDAEFAKLGAAVPAGN